MPICFACGCRGGLQMIRLCGASRRSFKLPLGATLLVTKFGF